MKSAKPWYSRKGFALLIVDQEKFGEDGRFEGGGGARLCFVETP